ncbi:MAG TPA: hydrolase [Pseudobdellovibrionaceae bacterium]|nr:hydrolase [Pseudobdellovibrionaceae bacterium]
MKYLVLFFVIFQANRLDPALRIGDRWVVWNVGQGLWITGVFETHCLHVDAGGERKHLRRLTRWCSGKVNQLYLSHWDWDHVGGVGALKGAVPSLCRQGFPGGSTKFASRKKVLESVRPCPSGSSRLNEVRWKKNEKSPNHAGRVWIWRSRWLFPGDSPQSEEKKWVPRIPAPEKIRILILGHHGSRTSTSRTLLESLSGIRLAVSSARKKVYGHPHPKVVERLAQRKIPLLRTEEWGHLIFEI